MSSSSILGFLLISFAFSAFIQTTMATQSGHRVYIVFTDPPPKGQEEKFFVNILIPVLGSAKDAKNAIQDIYVQLGGFAALLTSDQANKLKSQPGVVSVLEDKNIGLPPPTAP